MGIFSWFFGKQNKQSESPTQILPPGYDSVTIKGNGKYQLEVVGESYYQDALEEICGPRTDEGVEKATIATIVWEDDNPKDNLAVRIDIEGKTVGYLSRPYARLVRETVAEAGYGGVTTRCNAIIRGGWDRGERGKGHTGSGSTSPSTIRGKVSIRVSEGREERDARTIQDKRSQVLLGEDGKFDRGPRGITIQPECVPVFGPVCTPIRSGGITGKG